MNLVEKLLKVDSTKADEFKTEKIVYKRLGVLTGAKGGEEITIREIPARRLNDLLARQYTAKGVFDMSRSFDAKALAVAEAVTEPDLKDKSLQEHFGCPSSKDLAIKLFGNEISGISDRIVTLSGLGEVEETDAEIKN